MNKNYYKQLSQRYFEATLLPRQERRLMRFLSRTQDPEFDEVKAVAGYFSVGRSLNGAISLPVRSHARPWLFASTAAILAIIVGTSILLHHAQHTRQMETLAAMENTLTAIFSSGADIESELSELLTQYP